MNAFSIHTERLNQKNSIHSNNAQKIKKIEANEILEIEEIKKVSEEYQRFNNHINIIKKYSNSLESKFLNIKNIRDLKFDVGNHNINDTPNEELVKKINQFYNNSILYREQIERISFDIGNLIYEYIKSIIYCSFDFLLILEIEIQNNNYIIKDVYKNILEIDNYLKHFSENLINLINKKNNFNLYKKKYINIPLDQLLERNQKYINSINLNNFTSIQSLNEYVQTINKNRNYENSNSLNNNYFHKIPSELIKILEDFRNSLNFFLDNSSKLISDSILIEDVIISKLQNYEKILKYQNTNNLKFNEKLKLKKLIKKLHKIDDYKIYDNIFEIAKSKKKEIQKNVNKKYKKVYKNIPKGYKIRNSHKRKYKNI